MRIVAIGFPILLSALLGGCTSTPAPPAWQSNSQASLQSSTSAYLSGNTRIADVEFASARQALSATGRANLVAQAELVRCAARVASLELGPCTGFDAVAEDAGPAEQAYAAYIAGRWQGLDATLLPAHHRALIAKTAAPNGGSQSQNQSQLSGIEDPLARLVAAGALLQNGRIVPADIELATETASLQGWRRPLLAWLGVQAERARKAGAHDAHARIQRRIRLVENARK